MSDWTHLFGSYYWYPGTFKRWEYNVGLVCQEGDGTRLYKAVWGCSKGKVMKKDFWIQNYD